MITGVDYIAGAARPIGGGTLVSHMPAEPSRTVWCGAPAPAHVDEAVEAAHAALAQWSSARATDHRIAALREFQSLARERAAALGELICDETGKALWDAQAEAKLIADKVEITLDQSAGSGRARVTGFDLKLSDTRAGACAFRPHGVMAVVGPFNFPAHLPNGHIVPALLMGNTVVFKPSDKTPAVGQFLCELFIEALRRAGAPAGVMNMVHGGADVASALVSHPGIDGVLFTGSWPVGRRIMQANLDHPGRILALEMGGNNPAIVAPSADFRQALVECARSAFVTTGQRCTCTRRILVHRSLADRFVEALAAAAKSLTTGHPRGTPDGKPVFMGPLIRAEARDAALSAQQSLRRAGGRAVLAAAATDPAGTGGHFISPGIIGVDRFSLHDDPSRDAGCDFEVFAPIVRIAAYDDFSDALSQANATRFGLAASLFSREPAEIEAFLDGCRAGCLNVNTGTAGASSKLPFGGLGRSGNHRPAGSFALDYCAYPVASMIERSDAAALPPGMNM